MNRLYLVQVEVEPMEGCDMPEDADGAYVNVYAGAANIKESIDMAERALLIDRYFPGNVYSVTELDLDELDESDYLNEDMPEEGELLAVKESGGLVYGPFMCFPKEPKLLQ